MPTQAKALRNMINQQVQAATARNLAQTAGLKQQLQQQQSKLAALALAAPSNKTAKNRRRRQRQRIARDAFSQQPGMAPPQMRDGTLGNPADPRQGKSLRQLGQTQYGATWCLRALHPCGEGLNLVPKVPDGALSDSVIMERRDEYVLTNPFLDPTGDEPKVNMTWDCVVVSMPVLRTPTVAIAWTGPVDDTDLRIVARTLAQTSGAAAPASGAMYPDWGTVVRDGGKPIENIRFTLMPCATLDKGKTSNLADVFLSIRRTYCGLTTDYDANTLTDKGRVISGQFAGTLCDTMGNVITDYTVAGPAGQADVPIKAVTATFDLNSYTGIPITETELTQMDVKVRQAEAKCGDYMPIRFWEPIFSNTSGSDPACVDLIPSTASPSADYPKQIDSWNYPLKGWGFGMSFWRTMHATTSLRLKRREGLEMNTAANSDFSPFSTPAYPADTRAQTVFREYCRQQPHSFDSSYNSLGGMLGNILKGLGGVLGGLGIPIISDIAPGLGGILGDLLGQVPI